MNDSPWGFAAGAAIGCVIGLAALVARLDPAAAASAANAGGVVNWVVVNLGHSFWLFAIVIVLFLLNLHQLHRLLERDPHSERVIELDSLTDVWMHLFIGIGVIWTAVGMRGALQAALGDPADALTDSAGNVLRKLVDGGILLALTTTIVGGIGGYLMRLIKTLLVGNRLQAVFEASNRADVRELIEATERIEARLEMPVAPAPVEPARAAS
ncbi:MAG: hypothetical protein AAF515_19860 [Pseudomonadota bacterium]